MVEGKMNNLIDAAKNKGYNKSRYSQMITPKWSDYLKEIEKKESFVVGVGNGLNYLLTYYSDRIRIDRFIDNNPKYCYGSAGDNLPYAFGTPWENLSIDSMDSLSNANRKDKVFLITSIKYRDEIYEQLSNMGFDNCFSLLGMELQNRNRPIIAKNDDLIETSIREYCNQDIEQNKVVVCCGYYGDHGKSITKELLSKDTDVDVVWLVDNLANTAPKGVRKAYRKNWKQMAFELETAHIWIMDECVPNYIIKRKGQVFIQTKHWSSITLKKFFYEDPAYLEDPVAHFMADRNMEMTDFIMVGSDFDEESCRKGFRFDGPYIRVGSPRSDILFDSQIREEVHNEFGIPADTYIVLYVPTYRENDNKQDDLLQMNVDFSLWKELFEKKYGGTWVIMLKLHPATVWRKKHSYDAGDIVDASQGSDCQRLVAASDIVITDYSSVMFEPAFVKKPVFLFAPDRDKYINGERSLLLDYDSLPFPIAETNKELAENILTFDQQKYETDVTAFLDKYGVHEDGHASERAADFVLSLLNTEKEEMVHG